MNYTIKQYPDKKFTDKMDQTRFIKKHLDELTGLKKLEYKTKSEPVLNPDLFDKAYTPILEDITGDFIEVKTIINTTNVIDSHRDLHMAETWNKTVKDNPYTYHLKQHENKFESVISKRARSFNENMNFRDLGLNKDFPTVANINQFVLQRSKMPFMFDAYKNGDVEQHSIGMMYVNMDIAYYDEESQKQMDFFNEMKAKAVNPEVADEYGYFWVVYEAKKREGSAVVFGSNSITPTLYVKNYQPQTSTGKNEPPISTQNEAEMLQIKKNYLLNL